MKKRLLLSLSLMCVITLVQAGIFYVLLSTIQKVEDQESSAQLMTTEVTSIKEQHYSWLQGLTLHVYTGQEFTGSLDPTGCSLGKFLASDEAKAVDDAGFQELLKEIVEPHNNIHAAAEEILATSDQKKKQEIFHATVTPNMEKTISFLEEMITDIDGVADGYAAASAKTMTTAVIILFICVGVSVVISGVLIVSLVRQIVPPLQKMTDTATAISKGDIDVQIDISRNDEIGKLADAFRSMLLAFQEQATVLGQIADGDYTGQIHIRSEKDQVNQAVMTMLESNNRMISELKTASTQVLSGSQQISQGSQNLAAGSTEQASALEELSASVSEVLQQSEENSTQANTALSDVNRAGELMESCLGSMSRLTEAMQEISTSSQNISNVIKVIDDIAFQTNILALNAAVEAARAGQHGKGFAVVAEEVRSLASKSAEAATETAALIESSIGKVKEGNAITEESNSSIKQVAEIAGADAEAMNKINDSSRQQSASISEITEGLSQISTVVQQNSATSEESAASAEEMSAQAQMLSELVANFKIKEDTGLQKDKKMQEKSDFDGDMPNNKYM